MKTILSLFIVLFSLISIAQQGISVQGIARDNNQAAITDEVLTFTFTIIPSENGSTAVYAENQSIRTDNFGVYSHIIGTGSLIAPNTRYDLIDYTIPNLKLKIDVNYNGADIQVYDKEFTYTPYAHFAQNGVPTGTIVTFAGTHEQVPDGWLYCDGRSIPEDYSKLRDLLGSNFTPDLRGMFLRGAGQNATHGSKIDPNGLRIVQDGKMEQHSHNIDSDQNHLTVYNAGLHNHIPARYNESTNPKRSSIRFASIFDNNANSTTSVDNTGTDEIAIGTDSGQIEVENEGEHSHTIKGATNAYPVNYGGTSENRPINYGINYIIKL